MYSQKDFRSIAQMIYKRMPEARKIYLFGSYARGDAKENSDIDIAILSDVHIDRKKKMILLGNLWNDIGAKGFPVEFIIKSLTDFEEEKSLPTLSKIIAREGMLLWQKT